MILPIERLISSIDTVNLFSRQALLSHTDEIRTNINSQEVGEDSSEYQTRSSPSLSPVPMHSKIAKANKIKIRQCRDRYVKKVQYDALAAHKISFAVGGFMDKDNLCIFSSNPSFLGVYYLHEGFSIVMFIRTHYKSLSLAISTYFTVVNS